MPTVKVPLIRPVYASVDGVELTDNNLLHQNCHINNVGILVSRPSLTIYAGTSDYMIASSLGNANDAYFVSTTKLYKVSGSTVNIYNLPAGITKPQYTKLVLNNDGTLLLVANRNVCYPFNGATFAATQTTYPSWDTSLGRSGWEYIDGHHIGIDPRVSNKQTFCYSDNLDHTTWPATSVFRAGANPDDIVDIRVLERQIYVFGTRTIEIWESTGAPVFSRMDGGFLEVGLQSYVGLCSSSDTFYLVDDTGKLRSLKDGKLEAINGPYDDRIAACSTNQLCFFTYKGTEFLSIYADSICYALNINSGDWSTWTGARGSSDCLFTAAAKDRSSASSIMGTALGLSSLGSLSYDTYYVLTTLTNGAFPIVATTGHVDFGTLKQKRSNELRIRLARGEVSGKSLTLTIVDDNTRLQTYPINGGTISTDENPVVRIPRSGIFRTRQYSISTTDGATFKIIDAEEDIEVLRD